MIYGLGTTRGGTRTLATYLSDAGFPVTYEDTCPSCRLYSHDNPREPIKDLYRGRTAGDVAYVHALAMQEIVEVDPDVKFVHYTRNPVDYIASLIALKMTHKTQRGGATPINQNMTWTPRTGIRYGTRFGSDEVLSANFGYHGPTDQGWSSNIVVQLTFYWQKVHRMILEFLGDFPRERWFRVKMENLEEDGPKMLKHFGSDVRPKIVWGNRARYIKTPLTPKELQIVADGAGPVMRTLGYPT